MTVTRQVMKVCPVEVKGAVCGLELKEHVSEYPDGSPLTALECPMHGVQDCYFTRPAQNFVADYYHLKVQA
jgi:hypothetical protein